MKLANFVLKNKRFVDVIMPIVTIAFFLIGILFVDKAYICYPAFLGFIGSVLFQLLCVKVLEKKLNGVLKSVYDDCDPVKAEKMLEDIFSGVEITEKLKANYLGYIDRKIQILSALGQYNEAINLCTKTLAENPKLTFEWKFNLYRCIAECYLELDNVNKALEYIKIAKEAIPQTGMKKQLEDVRQLFSYTLASVQSRIDILNGDFDAAKKELDEKEEYVDERNYYKKSDLVFLYYEIGILSFEMKNFEKSLKCFKYIVDNGNKLAVVQKANDYIIRIREQNGN